MWLLVAATSLSGQTQAPAVTVTQSGPAGMWQAESSPPGTMWTAALRVDGPRIIGAVSSCASPRGEFEIFQGHIDGNTITFKCRNLNGARTITFTGRINGDEIAFTWERVGPGGNNPFFGEAAPRQFMAKRVPDAADVRLAEVANRIPKARTVSFDQILRADQEPQNWLTYSGSVLGRRYSALTQITPSNVKDLELAWIWQAQSPQRFQATALVVDGVLYTVQAPNDVVALDAVTGRVLWTHPYRPAPGARASGGDGRPNRGLAILGDTLFMGTLDAHLLAITASSGKLLWNTTVADSADPACKGPSPSVCYVITHAPLIVKNKVIVGTGGGDGVDAGYGIRGFIAAFDVATGKEAWRFSTIPAPGEPGSETWSGDSWKTGGVGVWNTGAYDPELNLTYWGTGNPVPNNDGSTRLGDNLYSNSVVALDADTGKLKWHYQFTPHDEMDWDAAQVPVLTDMPWQGRLRKVMLFANRNGLMYVLDRASGQFLMGKPFVEVNWMSGFDERGRPLRVASKVVVGQKAAHTWPGNATNWEAASYSPNTNLFYIPSWERPRENGLLVRGAGYGAMRAFDPQTGERKWEFKLNDAIFAAGALTTASDLLFTGVLGDPFSDPAAARLAGEYFYALDARTGRVLWRMSLAGSVHGGPMSYAVGASNTLR